MTSNILPFTETSTARYELRSWGEFSLYDHNAQRESTPRGRKACAIIAYLTSVGGERVNRERLTALLWSERGEEQARASLRQTLFELKPFNSGSPSLLEIERAYVRLNPALLSSDGSRFETDAQRGDLGALCHALAGRNGELFSGLDGLDPGFDEWLAAQRRHEHEHLLMLGITAGERGLEEDKAGMVRDLVASLQALDQTNEDVARLGMLADHTSGNHAAMHRRYQQLKEELHRELNVEPSAETQTLLRRLTGNSHADGSPAAPIALLVDPRNLAPIGQGSPTASQAALDRPIGATVKESAPKTLKPSFLRRKWTRRAAMGGLAAAGAGGGMFAYANWDRIALQFTDLGAAGLVRQGQDLQKSGEPDSVRQALNRFKKAATIDPNYAPAWAAVALAYRHPLLGGDNFSEPPMAQPPLIRAAANRALELDPGNAEAQLALLAIDPQFRHWQKLETDCRVFLARHPDSALGNAYLAKLVSSVGKMEEAVGYQRRSLEIDPEFAIGWGILAMVQFGANRHEDAHETLDKGLSRFPAHPFLWNVRYLILVGSKRYREAAAFVRDPAGMPNLVARQGAEMLAKIADALGAGTASEKMANDLICASCNTVDFAPFAAPMLAIGGATVQTFKMLEAYYFGGAMNGQHFPPPGVADERMTFMLFWPAMLALRTEPRFVSILERTGLEDYWRKTGIQPDFRKV